MTKNDPGTELIGCKMAFPHWLLVREKTFQ